jgi:hypothetical protein
MNRKLSMAKFGLVLGAVCLGLVPGLSAQSATVTVFATGLNNPRGLKFGPKGVNLFVAEGGTGGTRSTIGKCEQAPGPPLVPAPIPEVLPHASRKLVQRECARPWRPTYLPVKPIQRSAA